MAAASSERSTLDGRRVVITRAPEQSTELIRRLVESGAEVLPLPMVRFAEPQDTAALDRSLAALGDAGIGGFDWLVFTSANAVTFTVRRCRHLGHWPISAKIKIAAVGPATRDALEEEGLHAHLVPHDFNGSGMVSELALHAAGKHVLLPRSDL